MVLCKDVCAYGPKTEVAKRYFFVAEVLDATLMVGWGGACQRSCELAEVLKATLMMGVGWGRVGHANVRVNLLRFLMLR